MATTTRMWVLAAVSSTQLHAEPLPQTCDVPATKDSALTVRIQLTADAFKQVVFDHPKAEGTMPAGVIGQAMICACVDVAGSISDGVKLLRGSGSPQLDTEAMEIARTLSYPAGHPGCMHDTINFVAP